MSLCEFESFPFPNALGMSRLPQVKAKYFTLQLKVLFNRKLEKYIHMCILYVKYLYVCVCLQICFKDKSIA